jgi:hypothetical protein
MGEFLLGSLAVVFWIGVCFMWIFALIDMFVRRDLRGFAKALWLLVIIFLPVLGVLIYLIARPAHVAWSSGSSTVDAIAPRDMEVGEIEKLDMMRRQGILTEQEFIAIRDQTLVQGGM